MDLAQLRPTDTTAAAIAAALTKAAGAQGEAQQAVADAKHRRDELLLDSSPAQLTAAYRVLVAAKDLLERTEAITEQLRQRHAAAERAETLARLAAAKLAVERSGEEQARWWGEAR